jgi:hypothetical protein
MIIPANINQADPIKNLARAVLAAESVTAPSAATPLIPGATPTDPPIALAQVAVPGVRGYFDSFGLKPNPGNPAKTDILAELPFSPKIYDSLLDQRRSLISISPAQAVVKRVANPVAIPVAAANLEQYLYDQAVAAKAAGQPVIMIQEADPLTGRAFLRIRLTVAQSIEQLLAESDGGGGGGGA